MFQRQTSSTKLFSMAIPSSLVIGGGAYIYQKRRTYLEDPLLKRAILHLKKD